MGKKEKPITIGKPADNILPELLLALLVAGGVSLAAFSNLLFMEEGLYNVTADGMGHVGRTCFRICTHNPPGYGRTGGTDDFLWGGPCHIVNVAVL